MPNRTDSIRVLVEKRSNLIVVISLLLTFSAGVLYSLHLGDRLRFGDEGIYVAIARNIADDGQFAEPKGVSTAIRPPGYSALIAALMWLGGNVVVFRIVNYLALCAGILLVFLLLKRLSSAFAGILGALLVVAYPLFFFVAGTLYPQTVAATLFLLVLYLYFGHESLNIQHSVLIGLLFGALILTVATYAFALAIFLVWVIFGHGRRSLRSVLTVAAVTFVVIVPWTVRNCMALNAPVFVSANSGAMLLQGNSETSTPNGGPTDGIAKYITASAGMTEAQRDAYYRGMAIRYVLTHPGRSVKLYALKFLNYFNYRNNLAAKSESSPMRDMAMILTYGPLLILFVLRLGLSRRMPLTRFESFAAASYLLNGLFSAVFYTRLRYRAPFDLLLICVVALFLDRLLAGRDIAVAAHQGVGPQQGDRCPPTTAQKPICTASAVAAMTT